MRTQGLERLDSSHKVTQPINAQVGIWTHVSGSVPGPSCFIVAVLVLSASKTSKGGRTGEKPGKRTSNCMDSVLNSMGGLTIDMSVHTSVTGSSGPAQLT